MTSDAVDATLSATCWDLVVIGAGPAGSVAAIHAARAGARVLLVDKATFPRPKVCGCCLSDAGVREIESVLLPTDDRRPSGSRPHPERAGGAAIAPSVLVGLGAVPLRRMELRAGDTRVSLPLQGLCLSRAVLDAALVAEAEESGARFVPGVSARLGAPGETVAREQVHVGDTLVEAECVIIADGLAGAALAHRPEFREHVRDSSRFGAGVVLDAPEVRAGGEPCSNVPPGVVAMWVGRSGYFGAARLEDGRLNLAAAFDPAFVRAHGGPGPAAMTILAACDAPEIAGARDAKWRGTPLLTRRRTPAGSGRVLIVGDAAGYVEPFTGEGMTWAVRSAGLAAGCVLRFLRADPAKRARLLPGDDWARFHARMIIPARRGCEAAAWALRHPIATRIGAHAAASVPGLARWFSGGLWKPAPIRPPRSELANSAAPFDRSGPSTSRKPVVPAQPTAALAPIGGRA